MKVTTLSSSIPKLLTVIYGNPGTGKTYQINSLKGKTLVINFDKGLSSLNPKLDIDVMDIQSVTELNANLQELANSAELKETYDNIVFDTITAFRNKLLSQFSSTLKIGDWGAVIFNVNKVLSNMIALSDSYNVVIISQELVLNEDDPKNMLSTLDLQSSNRNTLTAAARALGRCYTDKNGIRRISFKSNPRTVTKLSIYDNDIEDVSSLGELYDLYYAKGKSE